MENLKRDFFKRFFGFYSHMTYLGSILSRFYIWLFILRQNNIRSLRTICFIFSRIKRKKWEIILRRFGTYLSTIVFYIYFPGSLNSKPSSFTLTASNNIEAKRIIGEKKCTEFKLSITSKNLQLSLRKKHFVQKKNLLEPSIFSRPWTIQEFLIINERKFL